MNISKIRDLKIRFDLAENDNFNGVYFKELEDLLNIYNNDANIHFKLNELAHFVIFVSDKLINYDKKRGGYDRFYHITRMIYKLYYKYKFKDGTPLISGFI